MKKILAKISISVLAVLMLAVLVYSIIGVYFPGASLFNYAYAESEVVEDTAGIIFPAINLVFNLSHSSIP